MDRGRGRDKLKDERRTLGRWGCGCHVFRSTPDPDSGVSDVSVLRLCPNEISSYVFCYKPTTCKEANADDQAPAFAHSHKMGGIATVSRERVQDTGACDLGFSYPFDCVTPSTPRVYCTIPTKSACHRHQGPRRPDFWSTVIVIRGSAAKFNICHRIFEGV